MPRYKLKDVINKEKLEEILKKFSEATGLAAIIADKDGVNITSPSKFTNHCNLVRSTEKGRKNCYLSDAKLGRLSLQKGGPATALCHCELVDLAAPLVVEGQCLGYILCGQVFLKPPDEEQIERARKRAIDFGLDPDLYLRSFLEIEIVPENYIYTAGEMLHIISSYIIELGINRLYQERLLEETRRRSEYENAIKTLELRALQSQVNPHFLFNTLNTAARLAYLENASKTAEIIYSLANLLHYSLKNLNQLVTLKEEISCIKYYLYIQQIRYKDHIKACIEMPEELGKYLIPVMSLQPLVENAIVHGLEKKREGGILRIVGYEKNSDIYIEIIDDGVGIEERMIKILKSSKEAINGHTTGLGIYNVDLRIKKYFGPKYGLSIESKLGEGTKVTIKIPKRTER
ncbi:Histidine kinase-, DNA gyrase B-, and HSP90-like ATPase [Caldanaerovirga acetigignens]|uniref:histidine kinase n=1 Tax=Caldanaerovirga acetigignens TaxID=447595 RepID=A0A1M7MCZ0_9FIRM|nr:PocR ligand-binding domain-containing protein [Caldanaerovirga acetigignens]SHM88694.1 Histidine kinase-, DNA gyrase B-, and HSP90-like ATPase [Caldanaerovirga acetigignens]